MAALLHAVIGTGMMGREHIANLSGLRCLPRPGLQASTPFRSAMEYRHTGPVEVGARGGASAVASGVAAHASVATGTAVDFPAPAGAPQSESRP